MNFSFTPQQEAFRTEVQQLLQVSTPSYPELLPEKEYYSLACAVRLAMGQKGWLTLNWPGWFENEADALIKWNILLEEMAYFNVPRAADHTTNSAGQLLLTYGTEELRSSHLRPLKRGEEWWYSGFVEPGAGSNLAAFQIKAVPREDCYLLTGQKDYGNDAPHSQWCLLLARVDGQPTCFLVDIKFQGVFLNPVYFMNGRTYAETFLDNVSVPQSNLVGRVGEGWQVVRTIMMESRSGIEFSARARRALRMALDYLGRGSQFLGPRVRYRLAEAAIDIEAARLLSYRSVWERVSGRLTPGEVNMAKLYGSEVFQRAARTALESVSLEGQATPASKRNEPILAFQAFYIDSLAGTIYLDTSETLRNQLASRGLGLPR